MHYHFVPNFMPLIACSLVVPGVRGRFRGVKMCEKKSWGNKIIDLTGKTFGRWKVLKRHTKNTKNGQPRWVCQCECPSRTIKDVIGSTLREGRSRSCGCLRREQKASIKHGMSFSPEYKTWAGMARRCHNPNDISYKRYGARGIKVCARWKGSFVAFFKDMGPKPTPKHSIDRIDNDGNYEPGNCRWATPKEQVRNKKNSILLTMDGYTATIAEWSEKTGLG